MTSSSEPDFSLMHTDDGERAHSAALPLHHTLLDDLGGQGRSTRDLHNDCNPCVPNSLNGGRILSLSLGIEFS